MVGVVGEVELAAGAPPLATDHLPGPSPCLRLGLAVDQLPTIPAHPDHVAEFASRAGPEFVGSRAAEQQASQHHQLGGDTVQYILITLVNLTSWVYNNLYNFITVSVYLRLKSDDKTHN